ncbi:uncharacterized protein LOC109504263 [Harpegnathos saltator]|uniref:uncharacterized protein LOC109504263 n=1 Tax=Harpegnathos saltator TaxID=610380 RepID=UPI000DBEE1BF|nr:uncharacterized protein LOC109504263 [Harpegnathos saltator]
MIIFGQVLPGVISRRLSKVNTIIFKHVVFINHSRRDDEKEQLNRIEAKVNEIYAILRDTQKQNNRSKIIKPSVIPIKSVEDVEAFEKSNDDEYNNVVQYLRNIGGFNAKEAITLCLKESIADSASVLFSWRGRKGLKALYNVRLVLAIFGKIF